MRVDANFLKYHPWSARRGDENRRNDRKLERLPIDKQILLISIIENVPRTIWRICILVKRDNCWREKRKALVMRIAVIRWLGDVAVTGKDEWSNKSHFGIISMRCAINADILYTYDIDSFTNQSQSFCFHIVFIQFALNWPYPRQTGKSIGRYKILIVMWKIKLYVFL